MVTGIGEMARKKCILSIFLAHLVTKLSLGKPQNLRRLKIVLKVLKNGCGAAELSLGKRQNLCRSKIGLRFLKNGCGAADYFLGAETSPIMMHLGWELANDFSKGGLFSDGFPTHRRKKPWWISASRKVLNTYRLAQERGAKWLPSIPFN